MIVKELARKVRNFADRLRYAGTQIACNVCGYNGRSWIRGRRFGRCPGCRCASRTRILHWYLKNELALSSTGGRLLHFAPEPALRLALGKWHTGEYRTCDLSRSDVDTRADIQHLPFADQSFELIICCHVLEHIYDDRAAMRELKRVCSASGQVLIQVPIEGEETREDLSNIDRVLRQKLFGEFDHWRTYGLDITTKLADVGFDVRTLDVAKEIADSVRTLYGFGPEQLFICRPA